MRFRKRARKATKEKARAASTSPKERVAKATKAKAKVASSSPMQKVAKATKAKARVASKAKARIGRMSCATRAARRVIIRVSAGTVSSKSRMLGVMQQALLHLALLVRLCRRPKALLLPRMCIVLSLSLLSRLT